MKRFMVTAIPHAGFDTFRRGGQTFSLNAREITVREPEGPEDKLGPDEVTPEQFEAIKADPHIKVETSTGRPANEAAKAAAEAEKAAAEAEEAARAAAAKAHRK